MIIDKQFEQQFNQWLDVVNAKRQEYWDTHYSYKPYRPLEVKFGNKFIKLVDDSSVWGFVSLFDGLHKGSNIFVGDLLRPATFKAPAARSRGNILDGTDRWEYYGPEYLTS